ncbi:MAG TPA: hypothetical protein VEB43_08965 [Anaeromyxobacter sp.]|nr:hypothetical protein [Anaeromyxobacter sp.]
MLLERRRLLLASLLLGAAVVAGAAAAAPEPAGAAPDTTSDVAHCGGVGRGCPAPAHGKATCTGGRCGFACEPGYTACGDRCVSLQSDVLHCGACGRACPGEDAPSSSYCDQAPRRACINAQCKKCRWYCGGYGGYYRVCT